MGNNGSEGKVDLHHGNDLALTELCPKAELLRYTHRDGPTHLVIDLAAAHPVEVDLGWCRGHRGSYKATLTVPSATQVCIFAETLTAVVRKQARGTGYETTQVHGTVGPGPWRQTRNVYEYRAWAEGSDAVPNELPLPSFAERMRVVTDKGLSGTLYIYSWATPDDPDYGVPPPGQPSGDVETWAEVTLASQPPEGLALGAWRRVLLDTNETVKFTATYTYPF